MIVTAFVIGCCVGGSSSSFLAEKWGRRTALAVSSLVFVVGGLLQVCCTTLPQLYAARVVSGVAVGISSAITPFFNSELAPADRRGMLVTLNQIFMTGGIMVAFWVNYALQDLAAGWRIAIALQCVPGAVLFIGGKRVPASTLAAGAASVLLLFVIIVVAVASSAPSAPRGPADGSSAVSADTAAPTSYVSICGKTDEESTCPRNFRCL